MNPAIILYLIRIASALLLLAFVGFIAWLVYREMRVTERSLTQDSKPQGNLRVVASSDGELAANAVIPLQPVTSLGRAHGNTIILEDGFASGQHALIAYRNGRWWVEDLGSRNGTLLNDVTVIETAVLTTGDIIAIGGSEFRVEI